MHGPALGKGRHGRENSMSSSIEKQLAAITQRIDKAAEFMRELKSEVVERLDHLEGRVARLEQSLGDHLRVAQARDAASPPNRPRKARVARTPGGKIRDPLLSELRSRKADIGLSVRQLAGLLGYPRKTVSNWLNRDRAPRGTEERERIQEWIARADAAPARVLKEWREGRES